MSTRLLIALTFFLTLAITCVGLSRGDADPRYVVDATEPVLLAQAETSAHPYRDTLIAQADTGSAASAPSSPETSKLPDPTESPQASASLLYKLYKAGHLIPMIVVASYFLLLLLQRWIAWLRTGYRKLAVASILTGFGMLAERAGEGTTPNLTMIMGAVGVAFAMWMKVQGEPKEPAKS